MKEHSSTATIRPNRWSPWRNPLEATRAWQSCRIWWRTPRSRCGANWLLRFKITFGCNSFTLLQESERLAFGITDNLIRVSVIQSWFKRDGYETNAIMRWWWHRHCRSGSCCNCYSDFCAQVSVGLENCQDLIADLDQALRTAIKCWQKW